MESENGNGALRKKAKEKLLKTTVPEFLGDEKKLLEELSIQHIELEMQNEELRQSQYNLQKEKDKYRQLYDYAPVAYITITSTGNIVDLNFAAAAMFDKPREVFTYISIFPFLHDDFKTAFRKIVQNAIEKKGKQSGQINFKHPKGGVIQTKVNCSIYNPSEDENQLLQVTITNIVDEQQQHIEDLELEKEKYREIFKNAQEAIFLFHIDENNHPGVFEEVNSKALELLQISGQQVAELTPYSEWVQSDFNFLYRAAKTIIEKQTVFFETFYYSKNKDVIPIVVDGYSYRVGAKLYGTIKVLDVRKRKQSELEIRESEKKYRLLAENMTDTIIISDLDFNIVYVSPSVERLTGYTVDEYVALPIEEHLTPDSKGVYQEYKTRFADLLTRTDIDFKNVAQTIELEAYNKDGRTLQLEVSLSFFIENGVPNGIISVTRDISDRKAAEKALRSTKERLEMAMEVGSLGWWEWDYENNILVTADKKPEMLGYDPKIDKFTSVEYTELIHPDDYSTAMQAMRNHLTGVASSYEIENRLRTKSGEYKWLFDKGRIVERTPDGKPKRLIGVIFDISDRKAKEEAIIRSERNLSSLLTNLDDFVFEQDKDGRYLNVFTNNPESLFIPIEEFIGKIPDELFPPDFAMFINSLNTRALHEGKSVSESYKSIFSDNDRYYNARVTPVKDKYSGEIKLVTLVRDISDRKKAEMLIQKQNSELKELNATKDKFFSIIAHDLKNPFNTILGFSKDLLLNHAKLNSEKRFNLIESVYNSARNSYALLENLLVWSRLQSNRMPFNPENIVLGQLLKDNVVLYSSVAEKKHIDLKMNHKTDVQCHVMADREMINTVVRNLISNALKYTPEKGVVEVGCYNTENNKVAIYVKDTGVGIKKELIPKLFNVEQTFSTVGTAMEAGTGLGLVLVHEFVTKNNGIVEVDSIEGEGSEFRVVLGSVPLNKKCDKNCFGHFEVLFHQMKDSGQKAFDVYFNDIYPLFSECYKSYSSKKVTLFSEVIEQFAEEQKLDAFKTFGLSIRQSISKFDVNQLNICFAEFDELSGYLRQKYQEL